MNPITFSNAIEAVYPKTEIQQCVVHQILNSTKFVSYNDVKALIANLKTVYAAVDEQIVLYQLEVLRENGAENTKSPSPGARTGRENFNRQLHKVTKSKSVFPIFCPAMPKKNSLSVYNEVTPKS